MKKILPHIISDAAKVFPEREAFRFGSSSLNYSELDRRSSQLASHLTRKGVKKGDRVGVYLFRSLEVPVAVYGIMKAGAAFVPLDPELPIARIAFLLNDCGIEHLVTHAILRKKLAKILSEHTPLKSLVGCELRGIRSISWDDLLTVDLKSHTKADLTEGDLAYIMYTSGSTGFPKGIMHTHKSGMSYARLSADLFRLKPQDRLAGHAPLHFDISTLGYLSGPLAGSTTIILSEAHTKMAASLANLIEKEKVTVWYSVPLALVQLLEKGAIQDKDLSALRLVLFGGELFANKYLEQWMRLCPHAQFYNVYGPAEVNQCTAYELKSSPGKDETVPIGQVWKETEFRILNEHYKPVKIGSGELAIHSTTMMKGYWNNEGLTQRSWYVESYDKEEKKFFKTGDMVRKNADGNLVFLGRNDRQVKIRGYRVEVDEIEAVLLKHENIVEAAVISVEKNGTEKEILAAIILSEKAGLDTKGVKAHCQRFLPAYAVPETIDFVNDFPRTGSGKIDRNLMVSTYTDS